MVQIKNQIKRAVQRHLHIIEDKLKVDKFDVVAPLSLLSALRHDTEAFTLVKRWFASVRSDLEANVAAIAETDPFDEKNALHVACELGQVACVRLFVNILQRAGNQAMRLLVTKDRTGASPLFLACMSGHADVVGVLLDGRSPEEVRIQLMCTNRELRAPLHVCAGYNHVVVARILMNHGAEIDAVEANKVTPLGFCAQMGSVDVARLLLSQTPTPADPMSVDWFRRTVLHRACEAGKIEIVKLLLDAAQPWSKTVDLEAETLL
ncbi:hypothetical protein HK405_004009 [Cladochytrium tenue]|nr:hypothetical protein HK405_004009 [Cladochytrium tenue]